MKRCFTVSTRAPRNVPRFCSSLSRMISSGSVAMLVVVVTPYNAYWRNCGSGFAPTWPCALMMPGTTNLPVRSCTTAPAGTALPDDGFISRMRPFSITMVTSCCGAAPVPSMTVAWVRTVTCAATPAANNSVVARTTSRPAFPISIPCSFARSRGNLIRCSARVWLHDQADRYAAQATSPACVKGAGEVACATSRRTACSESRAKRNAVTCPARGVVTAFCVAGVVWFIWLEP